MSPLTKPGLFAMIVPGARVTIKLPEGTEHGIALRSTPQGWMLHVGARREPLFATAENVIRVNPPTATPKRQFLG